MKYHFAIIKDETENDHIPWIISCNKNKDIISYDIVDITKNNWLNNFLEKSYDCILARPTAWTTYFKELYDERIYIINNILNIPVYPSFEEILIYENKKFLAYWLKSNNIPHPQTWVFYNKKEALSFADKCDFPLVAKTSIGSASSGVKILRKREQLKKYTHSAFSNRGITRKSGPNLRKVDKMGRFKKHIDNIPEYFKNLIRNYKQTKSDPQRWYVIFQEYFNINFEWRCVKIGNSYFAHKKIPLHDELISGTSNVKWENPPLKLLQFIKDVCEKRNFYSQAIDVFELNNNYYVNELQCIWGSRNPHQMIIDGKPGRYILKDGKWVFEEGNFCKNNSFDLRLKHVIELLDNKQLK